MYGSENIGAATASGPVDIDSVEIAAVDTEFWALILQDEELLAAEFIAIVSEPCETRLRSAGRPRGNDTAPPEGPATMAPASGLLRGRTGWLPGRRWRRERSPPPAGPN